MDKQLLEISIKTLTEDFLKVVPNIISRNAVKNIRLEGESTVITGIRRCGKSYFMRLVAQKLIDRCAIFFINFDDPRLSTFALEDFEAAYNIWLSLLSEKPEKIAMFFDEPQNIPGWEKWINYFAAKQDHFIILTGSNSHLLSSDLATFLTGRHRIIELSPLSFSEAVKSRNVDIDHISTQEKLQTLNTIYKRYASLGGFPRVWLTEDTSLLAQYFKDIVLKDISARPGAASAKVNMELGISLMSQASRLVNKTKLAEQLGFKQQRTVSKHIASFLDCYLVSEVRLFSSALKKQLRSLPKFYPADHALARETRFTIFDDQGFVLECMVANELRRRGYELFYWRSKKDLEVDFIARKLGSPIIAVQVTLDIGSPGVWEREIAALKACVDELEIEYLYLITLMDRRTHALEINSKRKIDVHVLPFPEWAWYESKSP